MKKYIFSFLIATISCSLSAQYSDQDIVYYIDQYKELAIAKMYEFKIPASITLAQGIFESACGTSRLAKEGNNHFGIKCHKEWTGDTLRIDDDALQECFRKYESVEESYNDHSSFLTSRQRYAGLFNLDIMDYSAWAHGLKAAGYATNPQYANRLINLIERFNIAHWDTVYQQRIENHWFTDESARAREIAEVQKTKPAENHSNNETSEIQTTNTQQNSNVKVFTATNKDFKMVKYPFTDRDVYVNNRTYFVIATENDTYADIAKDVQDSEKNIRKFNDINNKSQQPVPGEVVYIGIKSKQGHEKNHLVRFGETLRYISQQHAVQLISIFKYNNLNENSVIHPDDIIILKH